MSTSAAAISWLLCLLGVAKFSDLHVGSQSQDALAGDASGPTPAPHVHIQVRPRGELSGVREKLGGSKTGSLARLRREPFSARSH